MHWVSYQLINLHLPICLTYLSSKHLGNDAPRQLFGKNGWIFQGKTSWLSLNIGFPLKRLRRSSSNLVPEHHIKSLKTTHFAKWGYQIRIFQNSSDSLLHTKQPVASLFYVFNHLQSQRWLVTADVRIHLWAFKHLRIGFHSLLYDVH